MPNAHGQITKDDYKAPEGRFRIIEECEDGRLEIAADIRRVSNAIAAVAAWRHLFGGSSFVLYDDQGEELV